MKSDENQTCFLNQLKSGPIILFVGQNYLRIDDGSDPVLRCILTKYGSGLAPASYHQLFESRMAESPNASLAWAHEHTRDLVAPGWLPAVSRFPWSAVFTSAIDPILLPSFRNDWRNPCPIYDETKRTADPRNRKDLHITFLFGNITQDEESQRPPLTKFQWRKRRQAAISLARQLPRLVTPLGTLIICGYGGESDWLLPEELAPIVDEFNPGQVHLFGPASGIAEDPDFDDLVRSGKMVLHQEYLHSFLENAYATGFHLPEEYLLGTEGTRVFVASQTRFVPRTVSSQVSRSALILDAAVTGGDLPALSADESYLEFRRFLSTSDGIPDWRGYARGYAFSRDYQNDLYERVGRKLSERAPKEEPIVVHGQTGTGKTIALAALALHVYRERRNPVLFIEGKIDRPKQADIDAFCAWAESEGAAGTLVVWDGMVEPDVYYGLSKFLAGRGRKATIVGSCYKLPSEYPSKCTVEAPAELTRSERPRFIDYLAQFQPDLAGTLGSRVLLDKTFLSALFRLLPSTRSPLRSGVTAEARYFEQVLLDLSRLTDTSQGVDTMLGVALRNAFAKAGVAYEVELFRSTANDFDGESLTELQELTCLVMVPGQFGLALPLDLLMRTLGKRAGSKIVQLLKRADIFRWYEDGRGNIQIASRNGLEAQLIVESRMGGARTEIVFANRLLSEVSDSELIGESEITFAVELLRKIGPSGSRKSYYATHFILLSEALYRLRNDRAVEAPRLMLQEANLLRETAIADLQHGGAVSDTSARLAEAEKVLRRALDKTKSKSQLKSFLMVELASTLAAHALTLHSSPEGALKYFEDARAIAKQARILSPANYYPIDVLSWATRDIMPILDERTRLEAIADILHMFQTAEPSDFNADQQVFFHKRRQEYGELLNNEDLASDAFKQLESLGSSVGYYLVAFRKSGLPRSREVLTSENLKLFQDALDYLDEHRLRVGADPRCLDLMLELWWLVNTRTKFFDRERVTLALSQQQFRDCLDILLSLERTRESQRPILVLFLRALVLYHIGDIEQASEIFRLVESESFQIRGRWRIVRSYLASNPDGTPKKYHGVVAWVQQDRGRGEQKGEVYVEELRRRIQFFPGQFGMTDVTRGDSIGEFHIAFNFIGPIADPVSFYKQNEVG